VTESPLRKRLPLLALMLLAGVSGCAQAADTGSMAVSAVVPSKSNCKFSSGSMTLDFGNVDPASTIDATATASAGFTCNGSAPLATFFISAGDGLYSTGPGARRMRHTTVATEFMAYSLALSPTSATVAKGSAQTLTVTGTIQPFQFQNVFAGAYQDTVVITLTP
jgi:spore coat protein U-like protein